ncbi:SDR family NAD(P)-dependent oxidoreductase [Streptomyces nigra]|uniref:hypothetical protein n=1 Tax=Streptomyces nigra TaxID=1827580 RepID=UPI00370F999F
MPKITDRVVTIASNAHKNASLDLSDPNWERRRYRASAAYGQSKLANLLFTLELQGRLTAAGAGVRALAAHPGAATTGLNRHLGPVMNSVAATVGRLIMQSETDGRSRPCSRPPETCRGRATPARMDGVKQRGRPTLVSRSASAQDTALAA